MPFLHLCELHGTSTDFADSVARHVSFLTRVVRAHVRGNQTAEEWFDLSGPNSPNLPGCDYAASRSGSEADWEYICWIGDIGELIHGRGTTDAANVERQLLGYPLHIDFKSLIRGVDRTPTSMVEPVAEAVPVGIPAGKAVADAVGVPMPVAIASELVAKQEIGLIAVYLYKAPTHPLGIYRMLDLCVNDPVRLASARDRHAFVGPMLRDVADW